MTDTVDVLIIGAGLSGLSAAVSLHTSSSSTSPPTITILEVRDRVGGKLHSVARPDGKGVQELGAAWLNDSNQDRVWSYVKRFGLEVEVQNCEGLVVCEDGEGRGGRFVFGGLFEGAKEDQDSILSLRGEVERLSLDRDTFVGDRRKQLDNMTLHDFGKGFGATETALATLAVWCRGTTGQDAWDVSALAFLAVARGAGGVVRLRYDGEGGGQYLRVKEGTQRIAEGMARLLPVGCVRLGEAVVSVKQLQGGGYVVTTEERKMYRGKKVVISLPTPAYSNVKFSPPLEGNVGRYVQNTKYGLFVKCLVLFKTPWWREKGCCGLGQSFRGPINHCRDTSVGVSGNWALTCFVTAERGREWLKLDKQARKETVLRQLGRMFGVEYELLREECVGTMQSDWQNDEWAGWGCPFAVPRLSLLGEMEEEDLESPMMGDICFVGTEWVKTWRGYMEGAIRSGELGAKKVLEALARDTAMNRNVGSDCQRPHA